MGGRKLSDGLETGLKLRSNRVCVVDGTSSLPTDILLDLFALCLSLHIKYVLNCKYAVDSLSLACSCSSALFAVGNHSFWRIGRG